MPFLCAKDANYYEENSKVCSLFINHYYSYFSILKYKANDGTNGSWPRIAWKQESIACIFRQGWDLLFFILILLIGILYSTDTSQGLKELETSFSFLALPLIFALLQKEIGKVDRLLELFTAGVLLSGMICIINAFTNYIQFGKIEYFLFYNLTDAVNLQPTYFAYYIIIAITFLVFSLYYGKWNGQTIFLTTIAILFLFALLVLTGAQTTSIGLVLICSFFALKYLLDRRIKIKSYSISMLMAMVGLLLILSNFRSSSQIFRGQSDYWERADLWESAIAANPDPFFGVGTGDYKTVLNEYYLTHDQEEYAEGNYNSHNQFIQAYFSGGLLGLLALFLILARPLYLSFKMQNPLGILIMFPYVIYGVTEVFLGRYQGVVFFVLCHQIVVLQYYQLQREIGVRVNQSN